VEDDFIVIVSNGEKKCTPKFFPGTVVKKDLPKNEDSLYLIKVKKDELAAGLKRHKPNILFLPAIIGNEENTSYVMEMPLDNVVLSTPAVGMPPAVEPPPPILTVLSMKDWQL
jgi:hypothetical protein